MLKVTKSECYDAMLWDGKNTIEVLEFIKSTSVCYRPHGLDGPVITKHKEKLYLGGVVVRKYNGLYLNGNDAERLYEHIFYKDVSELQIAGYNVEIDHS